jgi:hypothetical protein
VKGTEASFSCFLFAVVIPAPIEWEGIHHLDVTSLGVVTTPGTRIASSSEGSRSSSVVRAVARHYFRSSSKFPGHVESSLISLRTSRTEEKTVEITRRNFSEHLTKSCSDVTTHGITIDKGDGVDLFLNCSFNAFGHGVTKVSAHSSSTPIDVLLIIVIIDIDSLSSLDIYSSVYHAGGRGPIENRSSSQSLLNFVFRPLRTFMVFHIDSSRRIIHMMQFRDS